MPQVEIAQQRHLGAVVDDLPVDVQDQIGERRVRERLGRAGRRGQLLGGQPPRTTGRGPDRTGPGPVFRDELTDQAPPMSKTPMNPLDGLGRVTLATVLPDCSAALTEYT